LVFFGQIKQPKMKKIVKIQTVMKFSEICQVDAMQQKKMLQILFFEFGLFLAQKTAKIDQTVDEIL